MHREIAGEQRRFPVAHVMGALFGIAISAYAAFLISTIPIHPWFSLAVLTLNILLAIAISLNLYRESFRKDFYLLLTYNLPGGIITLYASIFWQPTQGPDPYEPIRENLIHGGTALFWIGIVWLCALPFLISTSRGAAIVFSLLYAFLQLCCGAIAIMALTRTWL